MQGLSDPDILSQIGFLLTNSASTWYLAFEHMFKNKQSFVGAMRRNFLSSYHMIDEMDEISHRTQAKNESARSYLYHMVMLLSTLPFEWKNTSRHIFLYGFCCRKYRQMWVRGGGLP